MNKAEKKVLIDQLTEQFNNNQFFYITDDSSLSVAKVSKIRRTCFEKGITYKIAKNSLIEKALQASNKNAEAIIPSLKGHSAILFSPEANTAAKVINEARGDGDRPILKSAFIDDEIYVGDNQLKALVSLKSKEELIGDVIMLLQSPIKRVVGALKAHSEKKEEAA